MGDLLIRGMELPQNEPLLVKINPDGSVSTTAKNGYKKYEAVPIQPHGRLIDADVLAEKHRELAYELCGANYDFHMTARAWINSAPTITPAELAKEDE